MRFGKSGFEVWIKPGFGVCEIRVWGFSLCGLDQNRVCGLANPGLGVEKSGFRLWHLVNPSLGLDSLGFDRLGFGSQLDLGFGYFKYSLEISHHKND